ncbi:MAG: hypothetical protein GXZ15_03620 [Campylobacter sp.]|nr:hypothetical protein [Campylobacter sp.]
MKKYIENLIAKFSKFEVECLKDEEKTQLLKSIKTHISFIQHERLAHLLITMLFTLLLLAFFVMFMIGGNLGIGAIMIIFFVFEIFYIKHYWVLENGIEKLYKIYMNLEQTILPHTP